MTVKVRWSLSTLMAMVVVAGVVLWYRLPEWRREFAQWQANRVILEQLEREVPVRFPNGVTLEELFAHVGRSTTSRDLPAGLVIYVDPLGLEQAGVTMQTKVVTDGPPLAVNEMLRRVLGPRGLDYQVRDGVLSVSDKASIDP